MHLHSFLILLAICVIGSACGSEPRVERQSPIPAPPSVMVEPPDLTSSTRDSQIHVVIFRDGPEIPESLVKPVADSVTLKTISGVTVPFQLEILPRNARTEHPEEWREIRIIPVSALTAEWHEVSVRVPSGILKPYLPAVSPSQASDRYVARFHPDSAPVARYFLACQSGSSGNGTVRVELAFSENIQLSSPEHSVPLVSIAGVDCEHVGLNFEHEDGSQDRVASTMDNPPSIQYLCGGPDLSVESVVLVKLNSVRALSGAQPVRLYGTDAEQLILNPDSAWKMPDGCLRWSL